MIRNTDKHQMHKLNKNEGFSLVEVIVAMALLTITVGSVMMLTSDNTSKNVFQGSVLGSSACSTEADRILSAIKAKGLIRSRSSMNTNNLDNSVIKNYIALGITGMPGNIAYPDNSYVPLREAGISVTDRWDSANPVVDISSATAAVIRPSLLIMGYMTALQSIYNSDVATFCSAASGANFYSFDNAGETGTTFNTIFTDPVNTSLDEVKEYVKIETFKTATGAIDSPCIAGPINIRPPGPDETTGTLTASLRTAGGIANHPNSASLVLAAADATMLWNRGFIVTSRVTFKDRAGRPRECKSQERFQYSVEPANSATLQINDSIPTGTVVDGDAPEFPGYVNSTFTTIPTFPEGSVAATSPYLSCNSGAEGTNLTNFNLRITNARPGSIMMCRSLGGQRPANNTANKLSLSGATAVRQAFYSSELQATETNWYKANPNPNGSGANAMVAGLYYGKNNYYCNSGKAYGCPGLPTFPIKDSDMPAAVAADYVTMNESGVTVRGYKPLWLNTAATDTAEKWTPCERTSICNRYPMAAGFVEGTSSTIKDAYQIRYTGIPLDCESNLQVAEVDASFNISTTEVMFYTQERAPGNKVCFNGHNSPPGVGGSVYNAAYAEYEWFFVCTATATDVYPGNCSGGDIVNGVPCCQNYPAFPDATPATQVDP